MSVIEWNDDDLPGLLRAPRPDDDKYSRGVLGVFTGSESYPGAAVLGVEAALRAGAGLVRYLGPVPEGVLTRRPEAVPGDGRIQTLLAGSGTDDATLPEGLIARVREARSARIPVVLDAGALGLIRESGPEHAAPLLLTPHARELSRLLSPQRPEAELPRILADPPSAAGRASERFAAVVLLKGSQTVVAAPGGAVLRLPAATPWLASAGTGDVLAGICGTLIAAAQADAERTDTPLTHERVRDLAGAAARIHALAGEEASAGGPLLALDLAAAVPRVLARALTASAALAF